LRLREEDFFFFIRVLIQGLKDAPRVLCFQRNQDQQIKKRVG